MDKNDGAASLVRSDALLAKAVSDWVATITRIILSTDHVPPHWRDMLEREAKKIHDIANTERHAPSGAR